MSTSLPHTDNAHSATRELKPHINEIRPMLEHETFTLQDIDRDHTNGNYGNEIGSVLRKALQAGVLKKVEQVDVKHGNKRWRYRWAQGSREKLLEYAEEMATLPCGCRAHIPPRDGAPEGHRRCKYCGETHPKADIREAMP